MRKATRSCNIIRKAFWSWRRRSSSPATAAAPASATADSFIRQAMALEHQARRIAPAWLPQGLADPSRSGRSSKIPADVLVYGRNGVQAQPVDASQRELGIIVEATGKTREAAVLLASLLTHYLIHYGYPGRKATAGNIAYPLSPNLISFAREDGSFGAIVPSGTRDPVFFENYAAIKAAVLKLIADEFPDALENATYAITDADASHPVALLRTVDRDAEKLAQRHKQEIERITRLADPARLAAQSRRPGRLCLVALSPAAERGRDQEHHVPDHLLCGQRRRLDRAGFGTAALFRYRRAQLSRQRRRPNALPHRRPSAGRRAGRLAPPCSTWPSSFAARMPASTA